MDSFRPIKDGPNSPREQMWELLRWITVAQYIYVQKDFSRFPRKGLKIMILLKIQLRNMSL